ncbi:hypothetical protein BDV97DRAFT_208423 [Delphinella strobiligena]|nr:hypothetical protein BDV97DRAFT_208423 [Delphinella strobiligena]
MLQPLMSLLVYGWLEGASRLILVCSLHVAVGSHENMTGKVVQSAVWVSDFAEVCLYEFRYWALSSIDCQLVSCTNLTYG